MATHIAAQRPGTIIGSQHEYVSIAQALQWDVLSTTDESMPSMAGIEYDDPTSVKACEQPCGTDIISNTSLDAYLDILNMEKQLNRHDTGKFVAENQHEPNHKQQQDGEVSYGENQDAAKLPRNNFDHFANRQADVVGELLYRPVQLELECAACGLNHAEADCPHQLPRVNDCLSKELVMSTLAEGWWTPKMLDSHGPLPLLSRSTNRISKKFGPIIGQVVWARFPGSTPWWPAIVAEPVTRVQVAEVSSFHFIRPSIVRFAVRLHRLLLVFCSDLAACDHREKGSQMSLLFSIHTLPPPHTRSWIRLG